MSLKPVSCCPVLLVHSRCLEGLIAGLTALVQYTSNYCLAHIWQSHHTLQSHPSRSPHNSPLSCHCPTIRVVTFPFQIYPAPQWLHCHPSLVIFLLLQSYLIHLQTPIFPSPSLKYLVHHFTLSSLISCHLAQMKMSGQ